LAFFKRKGWLLEDTAGQPQAWLDPTSAEVRAMLTRAAAELLRRYRVDGLHLDFVRYPDFRNSLGPDTRRQFERDRRKSVGGWPESATKGAIFHEFVRWRSRQVTELVADMRLTQRREAPGAWLTAAVYGKHPACLESVGQGWENWIEQGYLDYVLPMNYSEDRTLYDTLVSTQTRTPELARRIVGGIGVTASESRLNADDVIDQVRVLRAHKAAGFALFDLDTTLEREILPILQLGLTAPATRRKRP
ncbi:MAG: family 10 glycosylhydrolase, partial [Kiritimatiellae bacterium]|nr:family 10 glycosylhydrolase [Kiritimatiellia bacterium]